MVALTALKPGDILYEVSREKAGNTTMTRTVCRPVKIIEVHENHVLASWNGNPPRKFFGATISRWRRSKPA